MPSHTWHDEPTKMIKMIIFTLRHHALLDLFWWWHHNWLFNTGDDITIGITIDGHCNSCMWKVISKLFYIDFIYSDICGWSCKKKWYCIQHSSKVEHSTDFKLMKDLHPQTYTHKLMKDLHLFIWSKHEFTELLYENILLKTLSHGDTSVN